MEKGGKMTEVMETYYEQILAFLTSSSLSYTEKDEQGCKRLDIQQGKNKVVVKVYTNGTIQIQGAASKLKEHFEQVKDSIENHNNVHEILPFEIERFPDILVENIPNVDPIIVRFIKEAIISIKAGSNLGCAFLLGGASEKAIYLLIDTYIQAISDVTKRDALISRTSKKFISKAFDEFKRSWKSSINKPSGFGWEHDIEIKLEQIFQFCRICRNESGHPHLPPNLDKGVLIANMGQFVKYIEDVYKLIDYYKENSVNL